MDADAWSCVWGHTNAERSMAEACAVRCHAGVHVQPKPPKILMPVIIVRRPARTEVALITIGIID